MSSILVTCRSKSSALNHYVPALRKAGWNGGIVLLAPGDSMPILEVFGGLLLSGGADIHPSAWDPMEPLHPKAEVDRERDALELHAVGEAWKVGLPILGICRGAQALNVGLGGSLHQDIADTFGCPPDLHRHGSSELPPEVRHEVRVDTDSLLFSLVEARRIGVNSRHHQAVKRVAPGLRAVAWHDDTTSGGEPLVEAIESQDGRKWALGVQWHPENMVAMPDPAADTALRIFRGFVEVVRG